MKKLIALEPEMYHSLTSKPTHEKPEKKILSELDTKMQEIFNSDLPAAEKCSYITKPYRNQNYFYKKRRRNQNELKNYLILLYCRKLGRKLKPGSS